MLISIGLSGDQNAKQPQPWDYYPELFAADKKASEKQAEDSEVIKAYESRRKYGEIWNRKYREKNR